MDEPALVRSFESGTLPPASFHHADHLHVAWILLGMCSFPETLARFSAGLRRFATAAGKPGLYHETITVAYLLLLNERRQRQRAATWVEFAQLNEDLFRWGPSILDRFYRPETLASALAREVFVWPDGNPAELDRARR